MSMPIANKNAIRNLTILVGSSLSVLAVTILAPALPAMLSVFRDVPHADLLVRLALTTSALFIAIGSPFSGFLLDRFGRKPVLIIALVVYSMAGSSGFVLNSIYAILLSRAILGLSIAAIMSGFTTLIIDYFEGAELNRFMGYQSAFISFGGMGFLFIGGLLADIDWHLVFLVHLFAVLVLISTAITVNEPQRSSPTDREESPGGGSAIPYRALGLIYLVTFVAMLVFFIFPLQVPFHLQGTAITSSLVGLALSLQGLVGAVIALQYSRIKERLSFSAIFVMIFFFFGLNHVILSISDEYTYSVIALAFGGLGIGLLPANINVWLASVAPSDIRGRAVGGLMTSLFLGQFFTPLVTQPFVGALGFKGMFLAFGIFSLIVAAIFTIVSLRGPKNSIAN